MNRYQGANSALSFIVLAASAAGLSKWITNNSPAGAPVHLFFDHLPLVGLWAFIVSLKIKMWIDDHRHFGEAVQEKLPIRIFGFLLGAFSMIFFALAGYQISDPTSSAELLVIGILISIAWLAVHLIEITMDKKRRISEVATSLMREKWIFINVVYCLLLGGFIGWFTLLLPSGSGIFIVVLFAVLAFDWMTSRQTQSA